MCFDPDPKYDSDKAVFFFVCDLIVGAMILLIYLML